MIFKITQNLNKINKRSVNEGDTKCGIIFPFQPVVEAHEHIVHIDFVHDPQPIDLEVLGEIVDVVVHERIHKFDEDLC